VRTVRAKLPTAEPRCAHGVLQRLACRACATKPDLVATIERYNRSWLRGRVDQAEAAEDGEW
jgi:hypothetical protein